MTWGVSEVLEHLLSREPDKVPVRDLETMHDSLVNQGYLDRTSTFAGTWTPDMSSASRRAYSDSFDEHLGGKHMLSTPVSNALNFLGTTTPAGVWQGVVGMAKGMVEQAPETAERLGVLGTAAATAGLGASVAGGAGALGGGILGGLGALWAELTDAGESKEDKAAGDTTSAWDMLAPWEDYRGEGGWQRFYEDASYIATAAAILKAGPQAGMAIKAAQGIGTAVKAGVPLRAALMASRGPAAGGLGARLLTAKKAPIYLGAAGGAVGGLATGEVEGVAAGAAAGIGLGVAGKAFSDPIMKWVSHNGLMAMSQRPLLKSVTAGFTATSQATVGARLAPAIVGPQTTVEQAINETARPEGAVWDAAAMVVYPHKLLPGNGKAIASWVTKNLGEDRLSLLTTVLTNPVPDGAGGVRVPTRAETLENIYSALGKAAPDADFDPIMFAKNLDRIDISAGIDGIVANKLRGKGFAEGDRQFITDAKALTAQTKRSYLEEKAAVDEWVAAGSKPDARPETPTMDDIFSWTRDTSGNDSLKGPLYEAYWVAQRAAGEGRGLEGLREQVTGEQLVNSWNEILGTRISVGQADSGAQVVIHGAPSKPVNQTRVDMFSAAKRKEAAASRVDIVNAPDPIAAQAERTKLVEEAKALKAQAEALPEFEEGRRELSLLLANKDVWTDGRLEFVGTTTEQTVNTLRHDLDQAVGSYAKLARKIQKTKDPLAIQEQAQAVRDAIWNPADPANTLLGQALRRKLIPQAMYVKAVEAIEVGTTRGLREVVTHLDDIKAHYPQTVTLPDEMAGALPETKTVVATGDDVITDKDISPWLAAQNIDEYAKHPDFWDTVKYWQVADMPKAFKRSLANRLQGLGLGPNLHTDHGVFRVRQSDQAARLNLVARRYDLPVDGDSIVKALHDGVKRYNAEGLPVGPAEVRPVTDASGHVKTKFRRPILSINEVKPEYIRDWMKLDSIVPAQYDAGEVATEFFDAIKQGSAFGAQLNAGNPVDTVRMLGKALRVEGMPGFVEFMRTFHLQDPRGAVAIAGGIGGAVAADGGADDKLKGAAMGVLLGLGAEKALKKLPPGSYGYLPDKLHRASMALRYAFSIAFDAGRHMENAMIGTMREGLPFALRKDGYVRKNRWTSILGKGTVEGDEAMREAFRLGDMIRGRTDLEAQDELMRWMFQRGMLGYAPQVQEAAAAYMIAQKEGWTSISQIKKHLPDLEKRVRMLEGYGLGRTNLEKSVNFFFFPLSFQKKFLTTSHDFIFQAPARAFLIHEGFRRYNESAADERFGEFVDKWIPMADQMKRLNNLAFGVSPGRFFLSGYSDQEGDVGRAAQAIGSLFVPSGANTPLAQAAGGIAEAVNHLPFFTPVVTTDETPFAEVADAVFNFVPAVRDVARFFELDESSEGRGVQSQFTALGSGGAPFYQLQHYLDEKRSLEKEYEPLAQALGYKTVQGFFQSENGASLKAEYDAAIQDLNAKYPVGFRKAQSFENSQSINDQMLYEIQRKKERSPAEEHIGEIAQMEEDAVAMAEILEVSQDEALSMVAEQIRAEAAAHLDDPQFVALYRRFFEWRYGPLERLVA